MTPRMVRARCTSRATVQTLLDKQIDAANLIAVSTTDVVKSISRRNAVAVGLGRIRT
jgi:hypothetical protein